MDVTGSRLDQMKGERRRKDYQLSSDYRLHVENLH